MENKTNILHTSGKITLAFLAFVLMFVCWIGNVFSYGTQSGTLLDLRRGSRVTDYMFYQPFADTYTMYFGTQSVTGSGTTGYIPGTSTALPRLQYNASALTFNFVGATLQNEGVDVTVGSDLSGYIAVTGGTGTGNVLTDTTLAGAGTISANVALSGNITANSLLITPTELSSVNNATGEIQAQITTATGSITNHVHTGADGTAQIAHDSITGTGTYAHSAIDTHIDNGYDPHGGTLTQTAATIAGVSAPYIAQTSGTGTDITLAGTTTMSGDVYFPGGIIQSDGDAGFGTTNPNTQVHTYKNTSGTLESKIENPSTGAAARIIHRLSNNASSAGMVYTGSNYSSGGRIFSFFQNDAAGITQFWNAGVKALEFDILGNSTFIGTVTASNFVGNVDIDNIGGIVITSPAEGHKLVFDSGLNVVNATDTAITAWSGITGIPTDNGSITVSSSANTIPIRDASQNLFASGIVGGTTTGALRIPVGTTAQRPGSPEIGMIRTAYVETYCAASGGSVTTWGTYTIHTFTASGSFVPAGTRTGYNVEFYDGTNWTIFGSGTLSGRVVEYLVVAGGGGGKHGGGGAGGMLTGTTTVTEAATVVTIGAGGEQGIAGNDSSIGTTVVAIGGGRGGSTPGVGSDGGSGGGGGYSSAGGAGTAGQGNNGGSGTGASYFTSGGGGGKGAVGANGAGTQSGAGGIGQQSSISGSAVYYAGGGGGGSSAEGAAGGAGGNGGGGAGGASGGTSSGTAGTVNTGGGGGGGGGSGGTGAAGGSGIVIIRYPTP